MIPKYDSDLMADLPEEATFWTPCQSEIDEADEGIGYFIGTWLIIDVTEDEARNILYYESRVIDLVDSLARDESEFETLANFVEGGGEDPSGLPVEVLQSPRFLELEGLLDPESDNLQGLDLGVSALSHALGAVGLIPAASCRRHQGDLSWTDVPVVLFASDRARANVLVPLVESAGCGFSTGGSGREGLLAIVGRSVKDFLKLAHLILDDRQSFGSGNIVRQNFGDSNDSRWPVDPNQLAFPGM